MDRAKTMGTPVPASAAPVAGFGLRLMSCAVALTECAEGLAPPASAWSRPWVRGDGPRRPAGGGRRLEGRALAQPSEGAPCDDAVGDGGLGRLCIEGWPGGCCTGGCDEEWDCDGEGAQSVAAVEGVSGLCLLGGDQDIECGEGAGCDGAHCWPAPPSLR